MDTAFMDRIHAYIPGWNVPKVNREQFDGPFWPGQRFLVLVLEPIALAKPGQHAPRTASCLVAALSGRDTTATHKTMSGLLS